MRRPYVRGRPLAGPLPTVRPTGPMLTATRLVELGEMPCSIRAPERRAEPLTLPAARPFQLRSHSSCESARNLTLAVGPCSEGECLTAGDLGWRPYPCWPSAPSRRQA